MEPIQGSSVIMLLNVAQKPQSPSFMHQSKVDECPLVKIFGSCASGHKKCGPSGLHATLQQFVATTRSWLVEEMLARASYLAQQSKLLAGEVTARKCHFSSK